MLCPVSRQVHCAFRHLNRLPTLIRFTSGSSLPASEVSPAQRPNSRYSALIMSSHRRNPLRSYPAHRALPTPPLRTLSRGPHRVLRHAKQSRAQRTIFSPSTHAHPSYWSTGREVGSGTTMDANFLTLPLASRSTHWDTPTRAFRRC